LQSYVISGLSSSSVLIRSVILTLCTFLISSVLLFQSLISGIASRQGAI
jgi:hypothetical protein